MGDFNQPNIKWTNLDTALIGGELTLLLNDRNLKQCVEEPTRGPDMLDLVVSIHGKLVELLTVKEKIGDYRIIEFHFTAS